MAMDALFSGVTGLQVNQELLDVVGNTGAAIVDVDAGSVTLMLAGTPAACDELERELENYTTVELHRTGRVALPRLGKAASAITPD